MNPKEKDLIKKEVLKREAELMRKKYSIILILDVLKLLLRISNH